MKKLILLSIVLCFVATVSAQIRYGIKAGGNLSFLYTSGSNEGFNSDQYNGRFGYHFGGVMEYSLSEIFSIQPELMYLNHGASLKKDNSFGMKDGHITLNTLQLPINLKASFNMGKSNSKVFVYGGPYIGYNIYGKVAGKVDGKAVDNELYTKDSNMKRFDYGVGIGVGIEVNKFVISLGNQIGMNDISGSEKGKMKTGNLSLSAGYFF
ncbi:outer membrane protein with beta-barrel domain [Dysgonomonas alginatilytica]|uniref:Outer membrane protein with beta-barrel domain n=1 Tax=Dysgonomonas alginatilytica TaxID=1605892 RepID=A0A2V3PL36_9BACT|nr:porin family protein [Dysgonomonas alginatilytica]PXV62320.1 outer membrane protein with beta-barrel domain [Dysgonomonas alginatilytica]